MANQKTILVTGGCGFIGSHFVRHWLKRHPDFPVVNLDKLTYSGNPKNLEDVAQNKNYIFIKSSIADNEKVAAVFKKYKPDYLVNFAAETHVDRSVHEGAKPFLDANIYGAYALLEAIKEYGLEKAVFVSTDEVYGSLPLKSKNKFTEKTQYAPRSPYSASKAAADLLCHAYYSTWKLPVIVTHCSNNYGTHQYPEKLIPFFTLRALKNKSLPLYGKGENIRDWIHVLDHVEGIEHALLKGMAGEVYNMGGDDERPNIAIARALLDILKKPRSLITFVADRPGHDQRYAIGHSKITRELGWMPRRSFDKMLPYTVKWYIDNPRWTKSIRGEITRVNSHIK